jgi:hypothetical protein
VIAGTAGILPASSAQREQSAASRLCESSPGRARERGRHESSPAVHCWEHATTNVGESVKRTADSLPPIQPSAPRTRTFFYRADSHRLIGGLLSVARIRGLSSYSTERDNVKVDRGAAASNNLESDARCRVYLHIALSLASTITTCAPPETVRLNC